MRRRYRLPLIAPPLASPIEYLPNITGTFEPQRPPDLAIFFDLQRSDQRRTPKWCRQEMDKGLQGFGQVSIDRPGVRDHDLPGDHLGYAKEGQRRACTIATGKPWPS